MNKINRISDLMCISLGATLITLCSWICIPSPVPFTMQLFAVFAVAGLLGLRKSTLSVLIYVLMGAVGLPVFSGFRGGLGILLSATGGYTLSFFAISVICGLVSEKRGRKTLPLVLSMAVSLVICYFNGSVWYAFFYSDAKDFISILKMCVIPFVIPDIVKIVLAAVVVKRTYPIISKL